MLSTIYRLAAPRRFEKVLVDEPLPGDKILVRPTYLSICMADQRYFLGTRDPKVLEKKLPMALVHEGTGVIQYDPHGELTPGTPVLMVPNNPTEEDPVRAENYLRSSTFAGSSEDGFLQELVRLSPHRIVPIEHGEVSGETAAFTELVSVSMHAISRFLETAHTDRRRIGIWGDGNLGYIVSLLLTRLLPDSEIVVFGRSREKLENFTFAAATYLTDDIPAGFQLDHGFECAGGNGSADAIAQFISLVRPEGTLMLMGVSEYSQPVETRMVLEKGLRLVGSSRSGRQDFENVLALYRDHPEAVRYLSRLVNGVYDIHNVDDITNCFEMDSHPHFGKSILKMSNRD
ncbi:MAG: alcohol dehydrogenase catalytic domain-containing protein [Bifidobacteriaceae bacterium]|jgi:ribitol-5-phosphate 2-dehydrogenase|nr:alcohol dehydrogenase catalytic domain-containing protein [Bifidobacteriaceae bacterium]MCI1979435.1 alcohol dehydrogenase catalytic domain-containing protein [Bifidobacteriaceae bacterium]